MAYKCFVHIPKQYFDVSFLKEKVDIQTSHKISEDKVDEHKLQCYVQLM